MSFVLLLCFFITLFDPFLLISIPIYFYLKQLKMKLRSSKISMIALIKEASQVEQLDILFLAKKILVHYILISFFFILSFCVFIYLSLDTNKYFYFVIFLFIFLLLFIYSSIFFVKIKKKIKILSETLSDLSK